MKRLALRLAAFLLVATAALFVVGYAWLRTSLPTLDGEVAVPGFEATVNVARTAEGLPTLQAGSRLDAYAALGFVHAQDRLWQMVAMRRFALGRLSERLGDLTLDIDIRQRRLGFGRLAQAQYDALSDDARDVLRAYAKGVNAYLATRDGALPLEFALLQITPEPWEPWHGLLWGRMMAHQLSALWRQDLRRADVLARIGPDAMRAVWPDLGDIPAPVTGALTPPPADMPPPMGASNAWAVAPERSATGGALLAGDPHLGLSVPGTWYLARLEFGGDGWVEGATAPGAPFVILGRNAEIAWSVTSNEADLQDLLTVTSAEVNSVSDTVRLRGDATHDIMLYAADGAPVVAGPMLDGAGDTGFALRATSLQPGDRTPDAFLGLNLAGSSADAVRALRHFQAPFLNIHIAGRDGEIVRVHAGDLPMRTDPNGRFPLPQGTAPWAMVSAHDVLPPIQSPSAGWVGNANERTATLDILPFPVLGDWPAAARALRLQQLADTWERASLDDMIAGQMDNRDVTAMIWRDTLSAMDVGGPVAVARDVLRDWDGEMTRDSLAPLIYASWMAELRRHLFAGTLGAQAARLPRAGPQRLFDVLASGRGVCADRACDDAAVVSFRTAVETLISVYGDNLATWRWGDAHLATFEHNLLSRIPLLGGVFGRSIPSDGGNRTLNRGASRGASDALNGFTHVHGAGVRAVHDLGGSPSRYTLAIGQSGNPLSRHYADLMTAWRDGRYVGFDGRTVATLRLMPQKR